MFFRKLNFSLTFLIGLWSFTTWSINELVIALNVQDDMQQIPKILKGTKLEGYKYADHRHITLMWLKDLDSSQKEKARSELINVAKNFFEAKNTEFAQKGGWRYISDKVGRFAPGGLYLAPTDNSKKILNDLYKKLHQKVKDLNLEKNIHLHLKSFTPHVTLAEAATANAYLKNQNDINIFLDKVNKNFSEISTKPVQKISLKIDGAHSWFQ